MFNDYERWDRALGILFYYIGRILLVISVGMTGGLLLYALYISPTFLYIIIVLISITLLAYWKAGR